MFQVRPAEGQTWQIVNLREETVFTGTLRQCEDWLDLHENISLPHRRPLAQLATRVRALFARVASTPQRTAAREQCDLPPQPKLR